MDRSWKDLINDFQIYLELEKSLSPNSVVAYINDISRLERYFSETNKKISPEEVTYHDLSEFQS